MSRIIGTLKKYFCVCVKRDAVIAVSPVKVSVCVPSPSQDSRRERSNNFQAFVKMALETLLGSCRRKHGGPRGKQGWEPLTFLLSLQICCMTRSNTASAHLIAEKVSPISIHHPLLVNLCFFPPLLQTYFLLLSALVYLMVRNTLQVKHCFELKLKVRLPSFPSLIHPPPKTDCLTVHKFFL